MNLLRLLVLVTALFIPAARAAETEPLYGWWAPPRDGTTRINDAITARLEIGIDEVNRFERSADRRCEEVAVEITGPLLAISTYYWLGLTRSFQLDVSPATATEYVERFRPLSTYRHASLFPFGHWVPYDPAVRVGVLLFGTDKLAHFFTNGARYYQRYVAARDAGRDEKTAEDDAIALGVDEELGLLGRYASGIISFADMEANYRGLRWFRSLCEGPAPGLVRDGRRWRLARPFSIAEHANPCWDEAWEVSAFHDSDAASIAEDVVDLCPRFRRPDVQERWRAYGELGCRGRGIERIAELRAQGVLPPPAPTSIGALCGDAPLR